MQTVCTCKCWYVFRGMEEEMILGRKADMGNLPDIEINIIKPDRAKRGRLFLKLCSEATVYGGWWDIVLLLAEETKA